MAKKMSDGPMTRQRLKNYRELEREIRILETQIKNARSVSGVVRGSDRCFPYLEHSFVVTGSDPFEQDERKEILNELNSRKRKLIRERLAIERFISSIPDSYVRTIISMHYIMGHTWPRVVVQLERNVSPDSAKKTVQRYLKRQAYACKK